MVKRLRYAFLIASLTLSFVAGATGVSLRLLPAGLNVEQAARWLTDATCYEVVAVDHYAAESRYLLSQPVNYGRLKYRDLVSLDTALLLIAPPDSLLVIDNEQGFITYRYPRDLP